MGSQVGKVVQRCLCCSHHLVHVLDGKLRPRLVVELLYPFNQHEGRPRRRVEQAGRVGVGVVEGDDDGSLVEVRRVAVELQRCGDALAPAA